MPSLRRISVGTEICPCAVSFEYAIAIDMYITTVMWLGQSGRIRNGQLCRP